MNLTQMLAAGMNHTVELLQVDFVQSALLASLLLGLMSGVIAPFIVIRQMSFAVHGTSELALMGAAAALLTGINVGLGATLGSILAAIVLVLLGMNKQDSAVGVVMSFGLGLSVLFIHLYPGNSKRALSLLTGQIVGVQTDSVWLLAIIAAVVIGTVALIYRPLLFASVDPIMAEATGVHVHRLGILFAILVGLTTAQSVQIVGALLVMALLITPGAAAVAVTSNPLSTILLSTLFALTSAVGGFVLSLAPGYPVSVFVTTISFLIYLICRFIGWQRSRHLEVAWLADHHDHETENA
ncbi:MAG: metal ABC transporter permease [Corynebacterium sp.]|nr:metal ABC transporter permease [Corynebacterium sp.]